MLLLLLLPSSSSSSSWWWKALLVSGLFAGFEFAQLSCLAEAHREHKVHNIVLYPDKHSWCKTTTIKQVVNYPGCTSVEIDNNVCVGGCFSYSIPHMEPSDPGEVIVPYCDSCQPSETVWRQVTLKCDEKIDPEAPSHLVKHVQIIQNCSCAPCEKNSYKLISKKFNESPAEAASGETATGGFDGPSDDLLHMQKHQHSEKSMDQQQEQQQQPDESSDWLLDVQQIKENFSTVPDAVSSEEPAQNGSGTVSVVLDAIITGNSSSITNTSNNTTTTTTTTKLNEHQQNLPPSHVGRWKKMYALTYALIKKVQMNNTRQDREQLIDMLNLLKTNRPAAIADFIEILQKEDRPLEAHEIQLLNDILLKLESSKFYRKHLELGKHHKYSPVSVVVVPDVVVSRTGGSTSSSSSSSETETIADSNADAFNVDFDANGENQQQQQHEINYDDDDDDDDGDDDGEQSEIGRIDGNDRNETKMPLAMIDSNKSNNNNNDDDDDDDDDADADADANADETLKPNSKQIDDDERKTTNEEEVPAPLDSYQHSKEETSGSSTEDQKMEDGGDHGHRGQHSPHGHPHQTAPHVGHHVNENIVPHGHLARGPHGALVIEPDRIHEKLDVNVHELKPNHAGTLLSYHSHSDESKKS